MVIWGYDWSGLDDREVGAIDFGLTFANADGERVIKHMRVWLTAYDRSGDVVPASDDQQALLALEYTGSVAPGDFVNVEWNDVWRKVDAFWYSGIARIKLQRIDVSYTNGDAGSMEVTFG